VAAASAVAGLFTARVLDADPDGDPPWLATEFVEGPSVRDAVLRNGPMSEPALLDLAQGLAEALGAIHAAGLVHRDLKPANVLLSPTGPRVIDFGIARAVDASRLTVTGQIIGTPDFMAPEQIEGVGESGAEVDVFALGSTLVWAATGRGPFAADQTAATLYRILSMPPDLDGVPPRVADLARACLAKDPARRPSAVQLAVRLRGSDPTGSRPDVHPWAADVAPQPAPTRGRRLVLGAGALVAVAVAGVLTAVVLHSAARHATPDPVATATASAVAQPATAPRSAAADPDSPQARYVDRLCASGTLLSTLGDTAIAPRPGDDPVQLKRDFLAAADRTIGTVEAALPDLTVLRDEAPTPQIRGQFGLIVSEFGKARTAFTAGRGRVAAAEPLTVSAYTAGVNSYLDGTRSLALAATLVKGITLPSTYTAASATVPHCAAA
jgi:hypothetical protein